MFRLFKNSHKTTGTCIMVRYLKHQRMKNLKLVIKATICVKVTTSLQFFSISDVRGKTLGYKKQNSVGNSTSKQNVYPVCVLPHVMDPVHLDSCFPLPSLQEVELSLREPGLSLQLLQQTHLEQTSASTARMEHHRAFGVQTQ